MDEQLDIQVFEIVRCIWREKKSEHCGNIVGLYHQQRQSGLKAGESRVQVLKLRQNFFMTLF